MLSLVLSFSFHFPFKHSTVKFHIIALKCGECGSYNTSRDDHGGAEANVAVAAAVVAQALNNVVDVEENEEEDAGMTDEGGSNDESTSDEESRNDDKENNDGSSVGSDFSLD